jgi:hypothetical protein
MRLETSEGTANGAGLTVMPLYTSFRDTKLLNHLSERHALRRAIVAGNRGGEAGKKRTASAQRHLRGHESGSLERLEYRGSCAW